MLPLTAEQAAALLTRISKDWVLTDGAHAILLGGEPFREDLVMWWNFVARSHEEIDAARAAWESHDGSRFADVPGHAPDERIPAPVLPNVRLRPRGNHHDHARSDT